MDNKYWRSEEARLKIVNRIMDTLQRHMPLRGLDGINELRMMALRFEKKIYSIASNQQDYQRKISLRMLSLESNANLPLGNNFPDRSFGNNQRPLYLAAEGDGIEGVYDEQDQHLDGQSQGEIEMVAEGGPPPQGVPVETIRRALTLLFLPYIPRDAPDLSVPNALADLGVADAALAPALQALDTLRHQERRIAELEGELRGLRAVLSTGPSVAREGEGSVL